MNINVNSISKVAVLVLPLVLMMGYTLKFLESMPQSFVFANERIVYQSELEFPEKNVSLSTLSVKPSSLKEKIAAIVVSESQVRGVYSYLKKINAPLAPKSRFMVQCAKYFGIDYRIVAAISVKESTGGKFAYRPYNAWGWGGSNGYSFSSWEESIITVSRGIARYYARGANTPARMAPSYNPVTPKEWAAGVSHIMSQM